MYKNKLVMLVTYYVCISCCHVKMLAMKKLWKKAYIISALKSLAAPEKT